MEKKEWFANWFDTHYYHLLYQHRDEEEARFFIDNILRHFSLPRGAHILDLACGKGRHSVYLSEKGYQVTGVDLSQKNIKEAKKQENENLEFHLHDMRKPFKKEAFDLTLNLFTSFGYFDSERENLRVLKAIRHDLKKTGMVLIDFLNVHMVKQQLVSEEKKEAGDILFLINRKIVNRKIVKDITFTDHGRDYHFQEQVQALTLGDFERLFKEAGLKVMDVFGNYQLEPYDEETSWRLIIVGAKV